jgi:transposase
MTVLCELEDEEIVHHTMAGVFEIPDALWERIESLIPGPERVHRLGGGRPRVPDREVLNGIFFVLRTGCQWRALDATGICRGSTAHDRFQQWRRQGFFEALWQMALDDYEQDAGIDWSWLSVDGSMGKALWVGRTRALIPPTGPNLGSNAAL